MSVIVQVAQHQLTFGVARLGFVSAYLSFTTLPAKQQSSTQVTLGYETSVLAA